MNTNSIKIRSTCPRKKMTPSKIIEKASDNSFSLAINSIFHIFLLIKNRYIIINLQILMVNSTYKIMSLHKQKQNSAIFHNMRDIKCSFEAKLLVYIFQKTTPVNLSHMKYLSHQHLSPLLLLCHYPVPHNSNLGKDFHGTLIQSL